MGKGQRTALWNHFSPSTFMCIPGIRLAPLDSQCLFLLSRLPSPDNQEVLTSQSALQNHSVPFFSFLNSSVHPTELCFSHGSGLEIWHLMVHLWREPASGFQATAFLLGLHVVGKGLILFFSLHKDTNLLLGGGLICMTSFKPNSFPEDSSSNKYHQIEAKDETNLS